MSGEWPEFDVGFDRLYGLRLEELGDGVARGSVVVGDALRQPAGLLHGGVYAAVAESLASNGSAVAVRGDGRTALGMSNQTCFLAPVTAGTLRAHARARHRGRTTWVWEVEFLDDRGRLCALSRVTVAIRPLAAAQRRR
ncbi:MAG TPA: PaaI family thioesterase [Solirubrobacteraceae bacterium]|nr:PaaI family thioesterase [Solirubrobacteraceae bacterium]